MLQTTPKSRQTCQKWSWAIPECLQAVWAKWPKIHKNACRTVIFHRNSTKFEIRLPTDLGYIFLKFFGPLGDNDGALWRLAIERRAWAQIKDLDEPSENRVKFDPGICSRWGVTSPQSFDAFQNGAQTLSVRISVTVCDRSMIFFFVSKVSTRPNYFEGQSQDQGSCQGHVWPRSRKITKTVIFHRNSTKLEIHLPSYFRCITLKFFVPQGDNDGTL